MSDNSAIEWTDATWNPVTGCTEVSPGCDNCYAKTFAERWRGVPGHHFENGFDVQRREDKLPLPLSWRKPRKVFVNSMSDLFHKDVPDSYIIDVFAIMALTPQHTYQILTKRHARMRSLLRQPTFWTRAGRQARHMGYAYERSANFLSDGRNIYDVHVWEQLDHLPNVWLGVSAENQKWADIRLPALLDTPAAVRWISAEPLLGDITLADHWIGADPYRRDEPALGWVVVGGESGHGARPMHPDWARSLRDQCHAADVPFLFKQWGAWAPSGALVIRDRPEPRSLLVGEPVDEWGHRVELRRVGKGRAGRELDGHEHNNFPGVLR